ncbi:MAG: amidohydrolase [Dehalococcoidia bacterium]|nr:amidohydrolase [Dehalococcoidia bacterium]MSQ34756.1 amidohydrolase [Dehalococcoidia bacterium]
MLIIDTHTHAGLNWFQPVETLLNEMNLNGVTGAVLVQHAGSYDNTYLFECERRFPGRFKVAVQVDPQDPKPEATLEKLKKQGAAGIRLYTASKFKTKDPYAMWKRAGELDIVVTTGGSGGAEEFGNAFKKILDTCPMTHVQIEHLAGVGFSDPPYEAYKSALECAKWPNTSLKVPGLGEVIKRPSVLPVAYPFDKYPPLFDMALAAFGAKRMAWGSDFPPSAGREGYRNCLEGVRSYPAFQKGGALDWILGKTAARVWGFKG